MLTIKAAASALSQCDSIEALAGIANGIGLPGTPMPLDDASRTDLGIPPAVTRAMIVPGPGDLRALLVEVAAQGRIRDAIAAVAAGLSARAPHVLPLLLLIERPGNHLVVAAWSRSDRGSVRTAALVADRTRILDSDAETVCALAASISPNDVLTHLRWVEVLGREALTNRFYLTLRDVVHGLASSATGRADSEDRHELSLLYASRLLFLSFVEAKGWLDEDRGFLVRTFEECIADGGRYEQRVLRPLFFGTLNTRVSARAPAARRFGRIPFLNGGLFTPTPLERRLRALRFGDETLGHVFSDLLGRYRFTAREDSTSWSEAAIDPEMLGKAFESLMASRDRKDSGAFYTPQSLVAQTTTSALTAVLSSSMREADVEAALGDGALATERKAALRTSLRGITVLDPACGSGAFLVHMLIELARLQQRAGDDRPIADVRRNVLARSIFGVDSNRTAVWLCELRLWLAVLIDSNEADPLRVPPLPNLDHQIRIGDTLAGGDFADISDARAGRALSRLRARYTRSSGNRKRVLARALDRAERTLARRGMDEALARVGAERREILGAQRGMDLFGERRRADRSQINAMHDLRIRARELRATRRRIDEGGALPFSFAAHFPDVAAAGGFTAIVGNPPWVRLHRIPAATREVLRSQFEVFRNAAWKEGAAGASAGSGFASQVDLAALFTERSIALLRQNGVVALLLPAKLWRSLAGGGVRALIRRRCQIIRLEDWTESTALFDAAVYPSLVVAQRTPESRRTASRIAVHHRSGTEEWTATDCELGVTADQAAPFLFLPPAVRGAFRSLLHAGVPMRDTHLGRPTLGVKCGLNEAFIVRLVRSHGSVATVTSAASIGEVERSVLRPALRGAGVRAWSTHRSGEYMVWTHDAVGRPMARLPRNTAAWLARFRGALSARSDARRLQRWWSLFRTEAALTDKPRVVWSDFGKVLRATLLLTDDPTVPLNSCYVCRCSRDDDALALCALLNSPLASAWLNCIAEPARGGFRRYLGWTVAMLPLPADWSRARDALTPIARDALAGIAWPEADLLQATCEAYGVNAADMMPLLEWTNR